jgi:protein ImuB
MPRVASLYLPDLSIDRLRRIGAQPGRPHDAVPSGQGARFDPATPEIGSRIEDCSCPRGGGWRPGARWARRDEVEAQIEALPTHQKPPVRELGRRSEAAEVPFRTGPSVSRAVPVPNAVPGSRGTPIVTIERSGQRMTVAAACPAARALGLYPGMAVTQAQALVPGLITSPAEPHADAALLTRLAIFAARRWTPRAALSDPSGLWLDLTGAAHLFGGEERMCRRILRFCARIGFTARIAVAGTPGAAHALARCSERPVTLCPGGVEAQALASLPVAALRIDEKALTTARRMGIERIGDLIAMPRGPLARRFGQTLLTRVDQALGREGEPFDPIVPEEPPQAHLRLLEPISTAEAIDQVLRDLIAILVETLERQGLGTRALALTCNRVDGEEQGIAIGTARATRDSAHLHRLLAMKIEKLDPGFGIEAIRLVAGRCEPLAPQPVVHDLSGEGATPDLGQLVDRLAMRLGPKALFRSSFVESDVPERSVRKVAVLDGATGGPSEWPRPVRLLSPPERIDKVMAELPDQPPVRFAWRGRIHVVRKGDGPERIHGEWWKHGKEADSVRDYFQVEDEEGARFWLFRRGDGVDPKTGDHSWWLHGAFG